MLLEQDFSAAAEKNAARAGILLLEQHLDTARAANLLLEQHIAARAAFFLLEQKVKVSTPLVRHTGCCVCLSET